MKALRFHEAARREANLAAFRFTEISIQLAQRFLDALQVAYASAAGSPRLYRLICMTRVEFSSSGSRISSCISIGKTKSI